MTTLTQTSDVPDGVLQLLRSALRGDLLTDVEAMATALHEAGWTPCTHGGSWTHGNDPAWSVQSSDHAPNVSIFAEGDHQVLLQRAAALRTLIDSGQVGPAQAGDPDPDWVTWSGGEVVLSLNVSPRRSLGGHVVPAVLQLAAERADTPSEGLAPDPERARQLAREGSPIARWYLAGQDVLPDDVVAVLAADADPAVRAALAANEQQRQFTRGQA
ncbi:hypothetical protein GTQ99_11685 [Kineococcus sp. T13]|uniref:hypothetical protein n=1 Tax=Kineococcus vitellinus TaxID=2696565 RepID=UPI0014130C9C|nr:hypothetical protein [Kineococcus vitellinus]NAZ76067.1 hypothetical protein [Kineococcus vitellinus]